MRRLPACRGRRPLPASRPGDPCPRPVPPRPAPQRPGPPRPRDTSSTPLRPTRRPGAHAARRRPTPPRRPHPHVRAGARRTNRDHRPPWPPRTPCVRGHVRAAPSPTFTTARPLCPPPRGAGCPQSCPRLGTTAEVLPRAPGRVVHCPPALEGTSLLTSTDTRSSPRRRQHRDAPPGTCTYESTLTTKRAEPRDRRPPVPEEGVGRLFTPVHTPVDDGGRPGSLLWTDPVLAVDAGARSAAGPPASTPGTGSGTAARTPCFVT